MPEIRRYVVTQTRETKVSASSPMEAIGLADKQFGGEPLPANEAINILKPVRVLSMDVNEEY